MTIVYEIFSFGTTKENIMKTFHVQHHASSAVEALQQHFTLTQYKHVRHLNGRRITQCEEMDMPEVAQAGLEADAITMINITIE